MSQILVRFLVGAAAAPLPRTRRTDLLFFPHVMNVCERRRG